jgi:hypothetical protein
LLFAAVILARLPGSVLWRVYSRDLFAPALARVGRTKSNYAARTTPRCRCSRSPKAFSTPRLLKQHENNVKTATLYLIMIDEHGNALRLYDENEHTIYPYKSLAEEHGL